MLTLWRFGLAGVTCGAAVVAGRMFLTWLSFGRTQVRLGDDPLLDRYMAKCEVDEIHEIEVNAPAALTYAAARAVDIRKSGLIQAIFMARDLILTRRTSRSEPSRTLLDQTLALGWRILVEEPGREVVVGSVTRPWEGDVRFRGLPPEEYASFAEPGYAKIVWTLAAYPLGASRSRFRTETRVALTDSEARWRFRRYWVQFSPGILLIRYAALLLVKREAEARWMKSRSTGR